MARRRTLLGVLASLFGIALLVWQVQKVGIDRIQSGLASVGIGFAVILALGLLRFVMRATAWALLIDRPVSIPGALAATIAGDTVGNITPLGPLVGEPVKAMYLGSNISMSRALAALFAESFFYGIAVAVYIMLGTAAMLAHFDVPELLRQAGIVALVMMALTLAACGWLAWQKPSVVSAILSRLPFPQLGRIVERVREFEVQTYGSVGHEAVRLDLVLACEAAFNIMSFLESAFTLWLLTGTWMPFAAFVLDTFSRIANILFRIVPFRFGVDQVGSELVAQSIGLLPATGTTQSLVRAGRMLVWATVGLVLLMTRGFGVKEEPQGPKVPGSEGPR